LHEFHKLFGVKLFSLSFVPLLHQILVISLVMTQMSHKSEESNPLSSLLCVGWYRSSPEQRRLMYVFTWSRRA